MTPVTTKLILMLCALALAGCSSTTNGGSSQETASTTGPETSTTTSIRSECADLADEARGLATEVGRLVSGEAGVDDVRAAANELSGALEDAKATVGPDARAHLDEAGVALQQAQDALNAQPIDGAALRAAANDLVTSLGDAVAICSPESATDSTVPTS
jgi:hypothetical protein